MLGSHKVVNKIFHYKYLTGFWICLEFWRYLCYTGFCRKQPIMHIWQVSEYSWALNLPRLESSRVVNLPRFQMVLGKLYFKDSQYFEWLESWICKGFEYIRSQNMLCLRVLNKIIHCIYLTGLWIYHSFIICLSSKHIGVLNMSAFIKKTLHHIVAWQGTDYSSDSAYTRVLNMLGLHKVLNKMLHHRCLTGSQMFFRFWTCHGFKYAKVKQGSEQNAPL